MVLLQQKRQPRLKGAAESIDDGSVSGDIWAFLFERTHKQKFTQEETLQPYRSFLICATPFDGSVLLCEALKSTGIAGWPEEYFGVFDQAVPRGYRENIAPTGHQDSPSGYWNEAGYANSLANTFRRGTSPNGVFGAKVLWSYFDQFVCSLRQIPMYRDMPVFDLLPTAFPNLQYVWFIGGDKVHQAISLWKAAQMHIWGFTHAPERQFVFNYEAVDRFARHIVAHEMEWLRFFNACDIQPFIVGYEDLLSDYEGTMHRLLKYLQLSPSERMTFTRPPLERQTDAVVELWCKRYYQIKQRYSFDSLPAYSQREDNTFDL